MPLSLTERQRRELWGLALIVLAILLTLSLIPLSVLGHGAQSYFPAGNVVGVIGATIADVSWWLWGGMGFVVPLLATIWGAMALGKLARGVAVRWTVLLSGLILLGPAIVYVLARPVVGPPAAAGWLGGLLGASLTAWFGWLGALLLVFFLVAALSIATLEWNPLRSIAGGGGAVWAGLRHASSLATQRSRFARFRGWSARRHGASALLDGDAEGDQDELDPVSVASQGAPWQPPVADRDPVPTGGAGGERTPGIDRIRRPADSDGPPSARHSHRSSVPERMAVNGRDFLTQDLPSSHLLTLPASVDVAQSRRELDSLGQILIDKLATFKIPGEVVGRTTGPVVTQFEVSPAPGIKVARIASLEADLALAMRAPSIRIIAPIPGKGAVGVEVPNPAPEMVYFREVVESTAFRNSKALLPIALGKDIAGTPYVADLSKSPHLLIAGATGSGKSVCVNTIVTSLVFRHSPRTLRLLMIDPKMVELSMYNDLPHLRHPVVTDHSEAAGVLKWAVIEMEWRYRLLSANGTRNLQDFNRRLEAGQVMRLPEPEGEEGDPDRWLYKDGVLPYVVLVIEELADLIMTVQGEVEKPLALLAQKARAIGIHLILATQRPSVNVITGLIKANFPSRIAFRVSSKVDSRTILDQNGADSLLGNGDMLFLPPGRSDPVRIQGAFLSTEETERLMAWYRERERVRREHGEAGPQLSDRGRRSDADILAIVRATEAEVGNGGDDPDSVAEDRDKLFREAALLCIQHQGGSTSLLQRRLKIGYGRAARIIDQLHYAGILGPPDGSKSREVLVDLMGLDQVCPD